MKPYRFECDIRKYYASVDKRKVAKMLVPILNGIIGKGHTWQCDDNGNVYILRGATIIQKL